ncbi:DNRLRE domain-containing protein [Nonomuraea thailandensis]
MNMRVFASRLRALRHTALIAALALPLIATPAQAGASSTTVSLPVRTDTWIDDQGGTGPYGTTLWAGRYNTANERTYLDFDTSSLAGRQITAATLKLSATAAIGCGDDASGIVAQQITSPWTAATLTWGNKPASTATGQVTARDPAGCEEEDPPSSGTWAWNVTAIAQAWASGQAGNGLVLRGADESPNAPLYDRGWQSAEAPQPPVLEVTYEGGGGPGPDTTPPAVLSTDPAAGATGVPADVQIRVTFSEPVDDVRFRLDNLLIGEPEPGSAALSADGRQLTFTPEYELWGEYGAEVEATDLAGNTMTAPYGWVFEAS